VDTTEAIVGLVLVVLGIAGAWRMFAKAGEPGWGAVIPIFNLYLFGRMAGRPGWWVWLYLVPVVNIVTHLIVCMDVAKNFGKSKAFGFIVLGFLGMIGFIVLGFGKAEFSAADQGATDRQQPRATQNTVRR
jgi:hypothetical protein